MEETRSTYMLLRISKSGFLPERQVAKSPDPEGKMVMVSGTTARTRGIGQMIGLKEPEEPPGKAGIGIKEK